MWGRCKFHNQADTEGYKPKAKSHCEKWKVTVSVSLEKRDLEAGEKQEALKKEKSSYANFNSCKYIHSTVFINKIFSEVLNGTMLDEMKCVFPTSGVQSVVQLSAASERTYCYKNVYFNKIWCA